MEELCHPDMFYRRMEMMRRPMRRHLGMTSKPATNEPEEKSIFHLITARSLKSWQLQKNFTFILFSFFCKLHSCFLQALVFSSLR